MGRAHCRQRVADGIALGLGQGQQKMLGGDVIVFEVFGLFGGALQDLCQRIRHTGLSPAGDLGKLRDRGVDAREKLLHPDARAFEDGKGDPFSVFQ